MKLKDIINKDKYRYFGKSKHNIIKEYIWEEYKVVKKYRKANYLYKYPFFGKIYGFTYNRYMKKFCISIPYETKIGFGLFIGHIGNIVINGNAVIGNNVNIAEGVCIGQENRGKRKGTPTIGDSVWVGANSVIVGNIKIGNNVLIAPNSFVNFDVPDNSVVVGNPAKIISNPNATENYINNKI